MLKITAVAGLAQGKINSLRHLKSLSDQTLGQACIQKCPKFCPNHDPKGPKSGSDNRELVRINHHHRQGIVGPHETPWTNSMNMSILAKYI